MRPMNSLTQFAAVALVIAVSPCAHAQIQGQLSLDWTVQQRVDGELSPFLHIMRLNCWEQSCSLQTITINQCWDAPRERSTSIAVEEISTEDEHMKPEYRLNVEFGRDALLLRYRWMGASFTHRLTLGRDDFGSTALVGYQGTMVKDSSILNRLLTVELVPVRPSPTSSRYAYRTLDCPLELPTVVRAAPRPSK